MTFMPAFVKPDASRSAEHQAGMDAQLLRERSHAGLATLLNTGNLAAPDSVYRTRLASELDMLDNNGFCSYFLIVEDYVQWAKNNAIAVGPGRGSGPCSLVGFVLGITQIDPIKYDLPFERFVNPAREKMPDFDLDFCHERRGEVTDYIQSKYGENHVAQLSSDNANPLPSRLVISNHPLTELVPLYPNPETGFPVAKMSLAHVASAGFVQFNAINQIALTEISRTVAKLAKARINININAIALDDKKTYDLLNAGEPSNIDLIDNERYREALLAIEPQSLEELAFVVALSQPRTSEQLTTFAERKQNPRNVRYSQPALKPFTEATYGVALYQEQVMHIAHNIAGFSFAEADLFRRAINKSHGSAKTAYKNNFIKGATHHGYTLVEASALYEEVAQANRFCANKSHAIAWAMLTYQTAWLKAHFPLVYARANPSRHTQPV